MTIWSKYCEYSVRPMTATQSLVALVLLSLCSCVSVESKVKRFHNLPPKGAGQTFAIAAGRQHSSLQASVYAAQIAAALTKYGWRQVTSGKPDYKVGFGYDVLDSAQRQGVHEIYGMTSSGGTTSYQGTVHAYGSSGTYSGTSYTPATYGVVGAVPYTYTVYLRYLVVLIRGKDGGTVFDGEVESVGPNPTIEAVLPQMISSLFTRFPGKSGEVFQVSKAAN